MKKKTTEQALNLLFEVQGNKYSYPNFEYLKKFAWRRTLF